MAQVQKVELEIKRQSPTTKGTAELIVRSTLSFSTEEIGNDFRLKIALYGSEEEASVAGVNPAMQPIYTFQFSHPPMILPKRDYTVVHALSGTIVHEETRLIPVAFLEDNAEQNQTHYLMLPIPNQLYAVVNLSTECCSNTVQLLYVPVGKAVPVKEKPHIRIHVI